MRWGASTDEGFVVFKGSIATSHSAPSIPKWARSKREDLVAEGKMRVVGDEYVVEEDILFRSSSSAASVVAGASYNGRIMWKDESGTTLAEIEDALLESAEDDD